MGSILCGLKLEELQEEEAGRGEVVTAALGGIHRRPLCWAPLSPVQRWTAGLSSERPGAAEKMTPAGSARLLCCLRLGFLKHKEFPMLKP